MKTRCLSEYFFQILPACMLHYIGTIWQAMLLLKYCLVRIYFRSGWGVRKAAQNIEREKGDWRYRRSVAPCFTVSLPNLSPEDYIIWQIHIILFYKITTYLLWLAIHVVLNTNTFPKILIGLYAIINIKTAIVSCSHPQSTGIWFHEHVYMR